MRQESITTDSYAAALRGTLQLVPHLAEMPAPLQGNNV